MAVSAYDENLLTEEQKRRIMEFKAAWEDAHSRGDKAGMEAAHAGAESVRAEANYSGGADGSDYIGLGSSGGYAYGGAGGYSGGGYTPAELPVYRARTEDVNRLYDAARDAKLSELRGEYEANSAALASERDVIPKIYQQQKNAAAAQSEVQERNFNEYAAASGLNSGAGGQARLAMGNMLQGELAELGKQEAQAGKELEDSIAQLKLKYQSDIASAVAEGEYKRAAALLEEYQREEQSRVSVAGAQADENYRAYKSRSDAMKDAYDLESESLSARERALAAARESEEASRREQAERELENLRKRAETLAKFGDFSGYLELGYTREQVETMERVWRAKNPELAERMGL